MPKQVRERGSALVIHEGQLLFVRLRDPITGAEFLSPPGGEREPHESFAACAVRETLEETGFRAEIVGEAVSIDYDFVWKETVRACRTVFFVCRLIGESHAPVSDADYNLGFEWIALNRVEEVLAYHPQIARAVLGALDSRAR